MDDEKFAKRPWITFRPEVTMGTVFSIIAWIVLGAIGWTKIGDRQQYFDDSLREERQEQAEVVKELGAMQQLNASQTAIVSMMQERLRQDERALYDEPRGRK